MRLTVVDRRREDAAAPAAAAPSLLAELLGPLGRPDWRLDLVLVDDAEMAALNARHRRSDGVTDVLSFGYLEAAAADADLPAGEAGARVDLRLPAEDAAADDGTGALVGEVVLAPAFIAGRCAREGWDLALEWALLAVHGTLHVLGWEHADAAHEREMRACEAQALARCGLPHPLLRAEDTP